MIKVSARTAHHAFSKYLDLAHVGEDVVITKRGKPWATLVSAPPEKKPNKTKKLDWNKVFERTDEIFKGRKVDAVKTLLELRDEEQW